MSAQPQPSDGKLKFDDYVVLCGIVIFIFVVGFILGRMSA